MIFQEKVYALLRHVPAGKVTTYKIIANKLGTKAYRAVGTALKNNPYAPEVPCHRVIKSDGSIGGFMGKMTGETIEKKINLLATENILIVDGKVVDLENKIFYF